MAFSANSDQEKRAGLSRVRWARLDLPGEDEAELSPGSDGHRLSGHARFRDEAGQVDLRYTVLLGTDWMTRQATVHGQVSNRPFDLAIERRADGTWMVNQQSAAAVTGCLDLDLNFTPATNLISLRRLALATGGSGEVTAAWLEFPDLTLKPLRQLYRRLDGEEYDYNCPEIPFSAILTVRPDGFVRAYPPLWIER